MSQDSVTMTVAGATVTLPAATLTKLWLDHVQRSAAAVPIADSKPPRIGELWSGQGGLYAGIGRGIEGAPDFHVILHADERAEINWNDAKAWAAALDAGGHRDFTLPTRSEQALLYANLKDRFKSEWYWSGEKQSSGECAWYQRFSNGTQHDTHTDSKLRARAVRRLVIQ